jgi:FtsZ-binding cell division protein ZapB
MNEKECEAYDRAIKKMEDLGIDAYYQSQIIALLQLEIDQLKTENEALKLLIEWTEECDFGYDNFPEEYERYKDEIEGMGYTEGMIHIAQRVYQQKRGEGE